MKNEVKGYQSNCMLVVTIIICTLVVSQVSVNFMRVERYSILMTHGPSQKREATFIEANRRKYTMSEDLSISDNVMEQMCAAAFRSLCDHLRQRSDEVQNIDLMSISGFCRNCLAKVCL